MDNYSQVFIPKSSGRSLFFLIDSHFNGFYHASIFTRGCHSLNSKTALDSSTDIPTLSLLSLHCNLSASGRMYFDE